VETEYPTSGPNSAPHPPALGTLVAEFLEREDAAGEMPHDEGGAPEEWRRRKSELDALLRSLSTPDPQP
jgi:hypothetical protein